MKGEVVKGEVVKGEVVKGEVVNRILPLNKWGSLENNTYIAIRVVNRF